MDREFLASWGLVAEIEFRMQVALTRSIQVASTRSNAGRPSA
ncbi:hypothetical protein SAMN05421798_1714, partial [Pseudovibrio axinellae]